MPPSPPSCGQHAAHDRHLPAVRAGDLVGTFVAQYYGAQRMRSIGRVTWQESGYRWLPGRPCWPRFRWCPEVIHLAGHPADVAALEATYYRRVSFGTGGCWFRRSFPLVHRHRADARGDDDRDCLRGAQCSAGLRLDLGRLGFPAWGVAGAAWATIVAEGAAAAAYFLLLRRPQFWRTFHFGQGCASIPGWLCDCCGLADRTGCREWVKRPCIRCWCFLVGGWARRRWRRPIWRLSVNNLAWLPVDGLGTAVATLCGPATGPQSAAAGSAGTPRRPAAPRWSTRAWWRFGVRRRAGPVPHRRMRRGWERALRRPATSDRDVAFSLSRPIASSMR